MKTRLLFLIVLAGLMTGLLGGTPLVAGEPPAAPPNLLNSAPVTLAAWLGCAAFLVMLTNGVLTIVERVRGGDTKDMWTVINGLRLAIAKLDKAVAVDHALREANGRLLTEVSAESKQVCNDMAAVKARLRVRDKEEHE
jgi:hypothetical protein